MEAARLTMRARRGGQIDSLAVIVHLFRPDSNTSGEEMKVGARAVVAPEAAQPPVGGAVTGC